MPVNEPRSFAQDDTDDLAEDVLYWANLFRATPGEMKAALATIQEHPEPEDTDATSQAAQSPSEPSKTA